MSLHCPHSRSKGNIHFNTTCLLIVFLDSRLSDIFSQISSQSMVKRVLQRIYLSCQRAWCGMQFLLARKRNQIQIWSAYAETERSSDANHLCELYNLVLSLRLLRQSIIIIFLSNCSRFEMKKEQLVYCLLLVVVSSYFLGRGLGA